MKKRLHEALCLLSLGTSLLVGAGQLYAQQSFPPQPTPHVEGDHSARLVLGGSLSGWVDPKADTRTLTIAPEVGYLFNKTYGVGLVAGYNYSREGSERQHSWSLRPFARYYYMDREPFNLYLDSGFGLSGGSGRLGWEVGVRPGACVDLTEGICLCLRMGFLGYRSQFTGGEEPDLGPSGWGLRFAPEELQIGLELEI